MNRIAALLALIALAVLGSGVAVAHPCCAPSMAPMAPMAHVAHMTGAPGHACTDQGFGACQNCCVIAPALTPPLTHEAAPVAPYVPAHAGPQIGHATPPALPPPRPTYAL